MGRAGIGVDPVHRSWANPRRTIDMEKGRRNLVELLLVIVVAIILAVGNVMVEVDETFRSIGCAREWTCRDCNSRLIHQECRLAEPLGLFLSSSDAVSPHRWTHQREPERLTVLNPFHWMALRRRGSMWPPDESSHARLDAQADELIRQYGSRLVVHFPTERNQPEPTPLEAVPRPR